MFKAKRSFFERLTGSAASEGDFEEENVYEENSDEQEDLKIQEEAEDGQLAVDVFKTDNDIIIQTIVAGVRSDMLDVSITRDNVSIKGRRENNRRTGRENYACQELYWGSFSRSISLPEEIDQDSADASIKNGILTIKLPLLNKNRIQKVRIKEE